uniref:CTCK domain-containing protein n=1 Tax=Neogobius melanostomus TaxID=47308 RepID=A0A8C6UVX3_9GOBI
MFVFVADCGVKKNVTHLVVGDCRSRNKVELTSCEGSCGISSSMYSAVSKKMMHSCTCCQEMKTSEKNVEMLCPGDSTQTHKYIYVDECSCHVAECKEASS